MYKLFINENLTTTRKRLLWKMKQAAKNKKYKHIWTMNWRISYNLPGYSFYYNNSATRAGGSGIYVSKSLPSKELINLHMNIPDCKDVWVEISTDKIDTIVMASIDQNPKQNMKKFLHMQKTHLCAINMSKKFTLLGNYNIDYSNYN